MKNATIKKLLALGILAAGASPAMADTDAIGDAITAMGGLATSVGAGAAAVIAVAGVFVAIKLGKRLFNKV